MKSRPAFSLLELLTVLAVFSAVFVLAVPRMAGVIAKTRDTQCEVNRTVLERAEERYMADHDGRRSVALNDLKEGGYIDRVPKCAAGGYYVWATSAVPTMGCSMHAWPATPAPAESATATPAPQELTPLGSTLGEISGNMAQLIADYRTTRHSWPRSAYPYNFTDIGLDPADWTAPAEHLLYSPAGSLIKVRPETGWVISVTTVSGKTYSITAGASSVLVYSVSNSAWYYKTVATANLLNSAATLVIPA